MRIFHLHFNPKFNRGDELVVIAIRNILKNTFPGHIYNSSFLFFIKENNESKLTNNKILKSEFVNRFIPGKIKNLLISYSKKIRKKNIKKLIKKINQSDICIIGGGGVFGRNNIPIDINILKSIKCKKIILSAGFNKALWDESFPNKKEEKNIKEVLESVDLISVRDQNSKNVLQKFSNKKIHIIPDVALYLQNKESAEIQNKNKYKTIGVNIPKNLCDSNIDIKKLFLYLKQEIENIGYDYKVIFLAHSIYDKKVYKDLKKYIPNISYKQKSVNKLLEDYKKIDLLIGGMLHSNIFALISNKPFISIPYDCKNISFLESIDHPYKIDYTYLKKGLLTEYIENIFENENYIKTNLDKKHKSLKKQINYFVKKLQD